MRILFLHGHDTKPGDKKSQHLQRMGHHVLNPLLPPTDFEKSTKIALEEYQKHTPDLVVGVGRGGAIAMSLGLQGTKMILIAPTWRKYNVKPTVPLGTVIFHCEQDEVVPFADSKEIPGRTLVKCGTDNRMSDLEVFNELENAVKKISSEIEHENKRKQSFLVKAKNSFYNLLEVKVK